MPDEAALAVWYERLEANAFPPAVLGRGIDDLIDRYTWAKPPAPADLIQACKADAGLNSLIAAKNKLKTVQMKIKHSPPSTARPALQGPKPPLPNYELKPMPREMTEAEAERQLERDKQRVLKDCEEHGITLD